MREVSSSRRASVALVHVADAGQAQLAEGAGEFGLDDGLAGLLRAATGAAEDRLRRRVGEQRAGDGGKVGGQAAADLGAEAGALLGRGHQLLEGPVGAAGVQREQAAGHQRHRRRAVGPGRDAGPGAGQEHDRLDRRLLRVEDQAGAAAADPDAGRQGDGHHEAGGDRRIHRGAAGREHLRPASAAAGSSVAMPPRKPRTKPGWPSAGPPRPSGFRLDSVSQPGSARAPMASTAARSRRPTMPPGYRLWAGQAAPGYDARHAEGVGPVTSALLVMLAVPGPFSRRSRRGPKAAAAAV